MGPVATLLGMDRTTLTAALKPLQKRGLVEVNPDPSDRRSRTLKLTAAGRQLLAEAFPVWIREHRAVETELPEGAADKLRDYLLAIG